MAGKKLIIKNTHTISLKYPKEMNDKNYIYFIAINLFINFYLKCKCMVPNLFIKNSCINNIIKYFIVKLNKSKYFNTLQIRILYFMVFHLFY